MSSAEEFDAIALAKLEEHYAAAGEPEELDDAFARRYFESLAAASGEEVIPLPGVATANFLKQSQSFVNVKFPTPGLKFGSPQSADWPFPGKGAVIGNVVPGQTGTFVVKQVNKILFIGIKNDSGKPLEGGVFIGFSLTPITIQSGKGTWDKL
ncbi:hypothetical protein RSOLAG22IIIB_09872 [Rhizoctonia solani]|uniref:Uncharacterized protein n=1 Tax=Rhizoctonia solani TaxID=456999 RepID=A0A0K6G0C2_9AGAM|nr:hypothetical protein RSOLAG22IIIB_09872 [Rhizoctonia solani]